jgi:antitoxin component of RelBE/YafQ-DinJ toxin-antitoxin module
MYLDNKTKSQEKDQLTKEEAKEILEKLGLPTKDDAEFSTDFYGTSE